MDRKEELNFMLKGAEVNVLYACKDVCEKGLSSITREPLEYAIASYNIIRNSLNEDEVETDLENLTEVVESNAE